MNNTAADPLAALKDIHPPPLPSWWPPAPGWWLLGGLALLATIILIYREIRRWRANRPIRLALREIKLENEQCLTEPTTQIRHLAALLRRFCLVRYPTLGTAALSGIDWINFLIAHRPAGLAATELECLASAPYAPECEIEVRKVARLIESWIKGQSRPFIPRRRRRP